MFPTIKMDFPALTRLVRTPLPTGWKSVGIQIARIERATPVHLETHLPCYRELSLDPTTVTTL